MQIYINGKFYSKEEASISVFDHGLLYGDGVFEGIRVYKGKIFRLEEHLNRIYESAKYLMLQVSLSKEKLAEDVLETVKRNQLPDAYIRLIFTRGEGGLGLDPFICKNGQIIIIVDKIQLYPQELYEKGLEIITASVIRTPKEALSPKAKSLNYLNNIMAKIEAIHAGVPEAIMLNEKGLVVECTGDNIFAVKNNEILTPDSSIGILVGVTRGCVIDIAKNLGYNVSERALTITDFYDADEVFLTGTAAEVVPVVKIDKRLIGEGKPGSVTLKLIEEFHRLIQVQGVPAN